MDNLDLTNLGGQFSGARIGHCRVCRDCTVLPAFGDDRCFGCTTDEIDEAEWVPQKQVLLRESEFLVVHRDILEIFDEAQQLVPAYKVVAGMTGPGGSVQIRRHGLWLPQSRRWRDVLVPSERMKQGHGIRSAINSYYKDLRKAHAAAGLCFHCSRVAAPGVTYCEHHQAQYKARYLAKKDALVCLGCGGPRDTEHGTCSVCIGKRTRSQAARAVRLLAAGLCTACGQRPAAPKWCIECMERRNAARRTGHRFTVEERAESARRAGRARWEAVRKARLDQR